VSSSVKTGVVGATGYTGSELVACLHDHPNFECTLATSRQHAGKSLSELYPRFEGTIDLTFEDPDPDHLNECDLLFLAVPHGTSMEWVPEIDRADTKVVDLAGDYRVPDPDRFQAAYGIEHTDPQGLSEAVYGLAEHNEGSIRGADFVANPGCYVTSVLLPLIPLVEKELVDPPVFVDSKSGISGAGRSPSETTMFMNVNDEVKPYSIGTHRHQTEMEAHLPRECPMTFVPHVVSADRGIESAIYTQPASDSAVREARDVIRGFCDEHEALRYREEPVGMKAVTGQSYCDMTVKGSEDGLVVVSCLDNLRKGAASQAIQNANLMFERPTNEGLL
jgi:N-acetyl-gamma-glutamyl-phosphate reductase